MATTLRWSGTWAGGRAWSPGHPWGSTLGGAGVWRGRRDEPRLDGAGTESVGRVRPAVEFGAAEFEPPPEGSRYAVPIIAALSTVGWLAVWAGGSWLVERLF